MGFPSANNFFVADYALTVGTSSTGLVVYTTNITLPNGHFPNQDASYLITTENASTYTALTIIAYNLHSSFGALSTERFSELTRWTVDASASTTAWNAKDVIVNGWLLGQGGKLGLLNVSTAAAGTTNATANFRIRKI